jgi:hypothetical protein
MHRQLVLAAIACLSTAGCAKNSAVVAGDPFLTPNQDSSNVAVAAGAQPKQTVSLDEHRVDQANFEQPAGPAPSDPWSTAAATHDAIKVPSQQSVNGRVGHFSVDYGTGTRIK